MMKFTTFALLVAMVGVTEGIFHRKMQNVTATGTVTCDGKTISGLKVVLWEAEATRDDKLAQVFTNRGGKFTIKGGDKEATGKIDPYILIHHECNAKNVKGKICTRISKFDVPKDKIYIPEKGEKEIVYEMGFVNLNIVNKGDTEKCK